jgi:hypothetical protein
MAQPFHYKCKLLLKEIDGVVIEDLGALLFKLSIAIAGQELVDGRDDSSDGRLLLPVVTLNWERAESAKILHKPESCRSPGVS